MQRVWEGLVYAARQLRRTPGYSTTAVLTLALELAGTLTLWSLVESVLLAPLPYPAPERLVGLAWTYPHEKPNADQAGSTADFLAAHARTLSSFGVFGGGTSAANLAYSSGGSTHTAVIAAQRVSQGFFPTLGVAPMLGRTFSAEEDQPHGPQTVVLSYGLWQRVFAGDRSVLGRALRINGEPHTIIGVMGPELRMGAQAMTGGANAPDLWQPLQLSPQDPGYDGDNYEMIARLSPGTTLAQVQSDISRLDAPFYAQYPSYRRWQTDTHELHAFRVWPLAAVISSGVRSSLLTLLTAAGAVLLVGALNLAGINVARGLRRHRELAVRAALGASRGNLAGLLLAESALIAAAGTVLGLLLASAALPALIASSPIALPLLHAPTSILRLIPAAAALAAVAALLFGLLPALAVLRSGGAAAQALRSGSAAGIGRKETRLARALIVAQVGVAMALVSAASLLVGSFLKLRSQPIGLVPQHLLVAQVALKGERYATTAGTNRLVESVLARLAHAPGVRAVAAISGLPLDRGLNEGARPLDRPDLRRSVEVRAVTPGYFHTAGIPLLAGRELGASDHAGGEPVMLISQTAARRWWPGRSPLGAFVRVGNQVNYRVVGIVGDTAAGSIVATSGIMLYIPYAQFSDGNTRILNGWITTSFLVRTSVDTAMAGTVQRAIAEADPELPVARLSTMRSFLDDSVAAPRFFSSLTGAFAGFSLLLAVLGLFGLLSNQVSSRTREIGLRMAVGADRRHILTEVVRNGLGLATAGLLLGVAASTLVRGAVESVMSDTMEINVAGIRSVLAGGPMSLAIAVACVWMAATAASLLPARRASSIEPAEALRAE